MNGLGRLFGPLFGAALITFGSTSMVMLAGGAFTLLSAAFCFYERYRERQIERLKTMTTFEHSFD
jgi:hypothetical protein